MYVNNLETEMLAIIYQRKIILRLLKDFIFPTEPKLYILYVNF